MSRIELLVLKWRIRFATSHCLDSSYREEWKDKLEEKLSGAGYNFDNDRPSIDSFINFGADIL